MFQPIARKPGAFRLESGVPVIDMSLTQTESKNQDSGAGTPEGKSVPTGLAEADVAPPSQGARASKVSANRLSRMLAGSLFRSLLAVIIGSLILRLAAQTMGQMLQFYFAEIDRNYFNISNAATGLITASFFIAELLGSPVLGALSDRYGRKLFIILGPLLGAIAVQITSMTVVLWILVITRLLEGLSTASAVPATLGYISEVTSGRPKLRARIVGLFEITLVGGIALGALVGGYLWKYFGSPANVLGLRLISPAFSLNGVIYLISFAIFVWGIRDIRRRRRPNKFSAREEVAETRLAHYRAILKSPRVWRFIPAWIAIFSIVGMWTNHSVRLLTGKDHYAGQVLTGNIAPEKFGNGFAVLAIIFAGGVLAWSFFLSRYRKTSVMLVATLGLFTTLLAVTGLNNLGSFASPLYYPLMGVLLVSLLALSGFTPAALTYLADVTESYAEDRGSIMGLYSVFLGVGQLIGTAAGGYFADWNGLDGLLMLSAIFGLITTLSLLALRKHESIALNSKPSA
ncbi:MAG: MFS transporter [Blastocatellia bacterium]|nr:MFS transporter [Blastocatellia bacterium]